MLKKKKKFQERVFSDESLFYMEVNVWKVLSEKNALDRGLVSSMLVCSCVKSVQKISEKLWSSDRVACGKAFLSIKINAFRVHCQKIILTEDGLYGWVHLSVQGSKCTTIIVSENMVLRIVCV